MWTVVCLVVVPGVLASQLSDEENAQFPRLFLLDDYERCLASPGGFYCVGSFRLGPSQPDNRVYQALEEYSKDQLNFNRTLLHRGYCVSSRCPNPNQEAPLNQSEWFADCVAQWARTKGFTTTPLTIEYCNSKEQANAVELDAPKIVFVVVVFCILFCNVIGSAYEVLTPDDVKKNKYLGCWSWTQNWRRLTAPCDQSDPRRAALLPAHGVRVITLLLVMLMHCGLIHYKLYSYNPHYLEKMMLDPVFMMSRNGTPLVCLFLLLSSFLLAHSLLQLARSRPLTCGLLPTCLLQRIARISPTYLLVVGFSATWWAEVGGGPLWAGSVRAEGDVCRRKFWAHALFVNNLVQPYEHCLIQTWFLAVDMQLYIVCCVLTITLARAGTGKRTLLFLTALFLATCLLNGALAYAFEWRSMLFIMNPESLRSLYRDVPSFNQLYTAPWGALPASVLGVLLAYLHAHLQETGFNFTKHKFLTWVYRYSTHLMVALAATGMWLQRLSSAPALAVHAAVDRPLLCVLGSILLLGLFQGVDGIARRVFSWHCWAVLSRLSLAALLLHWSVALTALAASPQPPLAGYYTIIWEWLATATVTYLLSVPLTLLVELPAQRTITALLT